MTQSQTQSSEGAQASRAPLYVPVRAGTAWLVVRMYRTPLGERTAVGFTSRDRLEATLGPDQPWALMGESLLLEVAATQGVAALRIDPTLVAPASQPLRSSDHRTVSSWDVPLGVRA